MKIRLSSQMFLFCFNFKRTDSKIWSFTDIYMWYIYRYIYQNRNHLLINDLLSIYSKPGTELGPKDV